MAEQRGASDHEFERYFDTSAAGAPPPHFGVGAKSPAKSPVGPVVTSPQETLRVHDDAPQSPVDEAATLARVGDVELDVKIELGRAEMTLEDVLKLAAGSVVLLDKLAGDLVDITANGRLVARGEVVVIDDHFCVRVVELIAAAEAA